MPIKEIQPDTLIPAAPMEMPAAPIDASGARPLQRGVVAKTTVKLAATTDTNGIYRADYTYNFGSVGAWSYVMASFAFSGAAIGDMAYITWDCPEQGLLISCRVTLANYVTVYVHNFFGTAVDPAPCSVQIILFKNNVDTKVGAAPSKTGVFEGGVLTSIT